MQAIDENPRLEAQALNREDEVERVDQAMSARELARLVEDSWPWEFLESGSGTGTISICRYNTL